MKNTYITKHPIPVLVSGAAAFEMFRDAALQEVRGLDLLIFKTKTHKKL